MLQFHCALPNRSLFLFNTKTPFLSFQQNICYRLFTRAFNNSSEMEPRIAEEESSPKRIKKASEVRLEEWQSWGTHSPVPSMVTQVIQDLNLLENDIDAPMTFGGNHGRLTGEFKVIEDKKHRAKYASLNNSEEKIQFFSARQIACRLLGSRGYLCQKCWLALEDCMCSRVASYLLWRKVRIWLYMHPKDFLRQNNTGKLLWQVFGVHAATLCLFGIAEHEEVMWNEFNSSGRNKVWCLYPNKNAPTESVKDGVGQYLCQDLQSQEANLDDTIHFILIDGTWSNSTAMFKRLQDHAEIAWQQGLRCLSLNTGVSSMHRLRPQPSWDRTCTAGAAIGLLHELQSIPELSSLGLDKQAEALENALEMLLEALTTRRLRMGRTTTRKGKHSDDIC